MALRNLTTEAMYAVSSEWVEPGSAAQLVLDASPLMSGLQPKLAEVHAGIAAVRPADDSLRQELSEAAGELDEQHDNLVRALVSMLDAVAKLTGDDAFRDLASLPNWCPDGVVSSCSVL